ncbi:hypothetical protein RYZ20_14385 [Thioclava sp. A2]|uniref:hypothetical protein n=1 Tax=Thioclava sp. FCG-A2 TaxID=3080562 RepID=UPI0029555CA6|nr:hypothetical protein [Thioclava sp. A2]MDV7272080.1 hypothetical protein [Thioclava sp. A2]
MIALVTRLIAAIGRRVALWGALALGLLIALRVAARRGRHAAEADFAIRAAEARVRALQTSKDIRHEVQITDRADLERRADRWMRD